jgi:hypothetical protein
LPADEGKRPVSDSRPMPPAGFVYDGRMQWWQQPFFQVALPIVISIILGTWYQGSRMGEIGNRITGLGDSLGKRIDDMRSDIRTTRPRTDC